MSWAPFETARFSQKFEESFGDQPPSVIRDYVSALSHRYKVETVVAALGEIMLRSEKRGRPSLTTIEATLESSGIRKQRSTCSYCLDVQAVPIELAVADPRLQSVAMLDPKLKYPFTRKRSDGSFEHGAFLDLQAAQKIPEATPERAAVWCAHCCPGSVSKIFRGADCWAALKGKFTLAKGYDHMAGDLAKICLDRPSAHAGEKIFTAQEIAKDDAFWEERFDKAESQNQIDWLKSARSKMTQGKLPGLNVRAM